MPTHEEESRSKAAPTAGSVNQNQKSLISILNHKKGNGKPESNKNRKGKNETVTENATVKFAYLNPSTPNLNLGNITKDFMKSPNSNLGNIHSEANFSGPTPR